MPSGTIISGAAIATSQPRNMIPIALARKKSKLTRLNLSFRSSVSWMTSMSISHSQPGITMNATVKQSTKNARGGTGDSHRYRNEQSSEISRQTVT